MSASSAKYSYKAKRPGGGWPSGVIELHLNQRPYIRFVCETCQADVLRQVRYFTNHFMCRKCWLHLSPLTHGSAGRSSRTALYGVWLSMKDRCRRPSQRDFKNYGGRGIKVCDEWRANYETFRDWAMINGYSSGLTIDRINNDGDYEPANCQWISKSENSRKTRRTKLTARDVIWIRAARLMGRTWGELSEKFGTSRQGVRAAAIGKTWKHLK